MNSYHSQTCHLGKVMVAEAVVAFGPSYVYCGPSLLEAGGTMVDGQN